jgi:tetratricopeptide (TPR) repeat protein
MKPVQPGVSQTDGTLCESELSASWDVTERSDTSTPLHETLMPSDAPVSENTDALASEIPNTLAPPTDSGVEAEESPTRPMFAPSSLRRDLAPVPGYTILNELGRGGMGVVYRAKQLGLNRLVALKMILSGKGSRKERELFRLEAEVIARLKHPNIVQIFEIGEHNDSLYFSLEFVEGGSLADVLDRQRPTPIEAARIMLSLAEAMDAAHSQGIVHRDLKPANVLMSGPAGAPLGELVPRITDFGLVKLVNEGHAHSHSCSIMGTPSYMPPEQAEGRNHQIGPPADIYALGAVLYDLLVGAPPFRGSSVVETLELVCTAAPKPPREFNPAVPHDLQVICLKCLEKEPEKRYRSARELANDLRAFLNGAPISARSYSTSERAWKWVRRRPTAAALLLVSVMALVGLAAGGVVIAKQQSELAHEEQRRLEESEALRKKAEQEWERAEANFREARAAVDELRLIGHRRLSSVPHVEGIRRELLEKALAFNERFSAINGDLPAQRQEVGRAHLHMAEIQELLGRQKEAERSYRSALASFTRLLAEESDSVEHRRDLAITWNDLAILQAATNRHEEAEKSFADAIALKAGLVSESADNDRKRDLARSYESRGDTRLVQKQPKEAEADYQEALRLLQGIPREQCLEDIAAVHASLGALWTKSQPGKAAGFHEQAIADWTALVKQSSEPRYRQELATALSNRGALAHLQARPKDAEADYEEATRLLTKLTGEFRAVTAHREALANVHHNHGQLLRDLGRHEESAKVWRAALPLWRRLVEDFPERRDYRQKFGQAHNELAIALASTNRLKEVEGLWGEAIAIEEKLVAEQSRDEEYWQDLVNSSANRLMLLRALPAAEGLESGAREFVALQERRSQAFPKVAAYRVEKGKARYVLAAVLVKRGKSDEALQVLRDAAADGYRDKNALMTQDDWQLLRDRDAFKKLLE